MKELYKKWTYRCNNMKFPENDWKRLLLGLIGRGSPYTQIAI